MKFVSAIFSLSRTLITNCSCDGTCCGGVDTAFAAVAWIWHDGIAAVEQEGENTQILLIETSS